MRKGKLPTTEFPFLLFRIHVFMEVVVVVVAEVCRLYCSSFRKKLVEKIALMRYILY